LQVLPVFANNHLRNWSYLLIGPDQTCLVVDPYSSEQLGQIIDAAGLKLLGIMNTHQHQDHIQGNAGLISQYSARVLTPQDSTSFEFGDARVRFVHTPGHTMDHYSIEVVDETEMRHLFTGDTLFHFGVGNCKHGGNVDVLYATITNIYSQFSNDCFIYPGHDYFANNLAFCLNLLPGYATWQQQKQLIQVRNLGEERQLNPFLNSDLRQLIFQNNFSLDTDKKRFLQLRSLRDQW
jgi:hydroxyacylglutathione hydrolase